MPIGIFLLVAFPDWSLMYLVDTQELPFRREILVVTGPLAGLGALLLTRKLSAKGHVLAAVGVIALGLGGVGLVVSAGRAQLAHVGSTTAFRTGAPSLRALFDTSLAYLLAAAILALVVSWAVSLWRLWSYERAAGPRGRYSAPTLLREGGSQAEGGGRHGHNPTPVNR